MLDIKELRADPERARARLERRGDPEILEILESALALDEERREIIGEVEELKACRNRTSEEIGRLKREGEDASDLIREMQGVAERIRGMDQELSDVEDALRSRLLRIPNCPDDRVPRGGEDDFEVLSSWGERPTFDFEPVPHWDLGEELGFLDLRRGARVAGSGFPVLVGKGARLQRGLVALMMDLHLKEHGYREVAPPYLVSRESMTGTGHLPKFEGDAYRTALDDLFLVPTAEVPLTNLHRDEILDADDLPLAYAAATPCFRREAGSAGRETRGLLRVHQFEKVELVRLVAPERAREELDLLTGHAERVLRTLELPYRKILLATDDLGFANSLTYDLEVWSAGVGEWLEVSSCSTFTDYQARRANIRYRPAPGRGPEFVHTLNGSGVALARTLVALLENGQREDGSIVLPEAVHPYVGFDRIEAS